MKLNNIFALCFLGLILSGNLACRHVPDSAQIRKPIYYICPMHPSVKIAVPGDCPICGMKLVPAFVEIENGPVAPCGAACCAIAPGATN